VCDSYLEFAHCFEIAGTGSSPERFAVPKQIDWTDGDEKRDYGKPEGLLSVERPNGSPNITAVILDYGQVLAQSPTQEEFGRMAKMFNVSLESFFDLWEASRGPYDRGDLTAEEYWLKFAAQTNSSIDCKQIEILREVEVEIWAHPNPGMFEWVRELRAAGIKTGLLSNMPWDLVNYVRKNCAWMEDFTFKTLSAEVNLIKPDPAIYEHTLRGLGATASETLFVDDRDPNVRAARALGMRAIQFRSIAQLMEDLAALGFPVLPKVAESTSSSTQADPNRENKFSPLL
jgi:putative hydrolase of the HAD superfamily